MTWSYKPDLKKTTQNIITSMNGLVPTSRGGWRPMYGKSSVWTGGASGFTDTRYNGSFAAVSSSGAVRIFLATNASNPSAKGKLWEVIGTSTLTDRSAVAAYTLGAASYVAFFSFCQLGDVTIATNRSDAPQSATTGDFSILAGSPPLAKFCVADKNQVVLLNYYYSATDVSDGWWCSDVGTTTTWTPSSSNEAKNGRLMDSGGAITAACAAPFGGVMAFKKNACYIGTYEGQPRVRGWRLVSPKIGCPFPEAAIPADDVVYFVGDDVYMFDGSRVVSITEGVRADFRVALAAYSRVALQFDQYNALLYVFLGDSTNANFSIYYAFHTKTGEWGTGVLNAPILGVLNATPEESAAWGSTLRAPNPFWEADALTAPAYVKNLSVLSLATPDDSSSVDITWTTGYQGDPYKATTVSSVTPVFTHGTSTISQNAHGIPANVSAYTLAISSYKFIPGGTASASATSTLNSSGRFDIMATGNWHQATYTVDLNNVLTEGFEWFDHLPSYMTAGAI